MSFVVRPSYPLENHRDLKSLAICLRSLAFQKKPSDREKKEKESLIGQDTQEEKKGRGYTNIQRGTHISL